MKKNAFVYVKKFEGREYLYVDIETEKGVVSLPIKQSFFNRKLQYLLVKNLPTK